MYAKDLGTDARAKMLMWVRSLMGLRMSLVGSKRSCMCEACERWWLGNRWVISFAVVGNAVSLSRIVYWALDGPSVVVPCGKVSRLPGSCAYLWRVEWGIDE